LLSQKKVNLHKVIASLFMSAAIANRRLSLLNSHLCQLQIDPQNMMLTQARSTARVTLLLAFLQTG
jgi:hypothetical protein